MKVGKPRLQKLQAARAPGFHLITYRVHSHANHRWGCLKQIAPNWQRHLRMLYHGCHCYFWNLGKCPVHFQSSASECQLFEKQTELLWDFPGPAGPASRSTFGQCQKRTSSFPLTSSLPRLMKEQHRKTIKGIHCWTARELTTYHIHWKFCFLSRTPYHL